MASILEYESVFLLQLPEPYWPSKDQDKIITIWCNNNQRIRNKQGQEKRHLNKLPVLHFVNGKFIHITRQISSETNKQLDPSTLQVEAATTLYLSHSREVNEDCNVRYGILQHSNGNCYIHSELEYPAHIANDGKRLHNLEMNWLKELDMLYSVPSNLAELTANNLIQLIPRPFTLLMEDPYIPEVKPKHDGYQVKWIHHSGGCGLLTSFAKWEECTPHNYPNVCLQLEVCKSYIVIVDVFAVTINNQVVRPTPINNVHIIQQISLPDTFCGLKLQRTNFISKLKPEELNEFELDGYIGVNHFIEIKLKVPTFDCLAVQGCLVCNNRVIQTVNEVPIENGSVYEVGIFNGRTHVLRKRPDKISASSQEEYFDVMRSVEYLRRVANKRPKPVK